LRGGGPGASTTKPANFFYLTIKSGNHNEIAKMFRSLQADAETLINSVIELVYFMRGAIQYEEMMMRTPGERQLIQKFLQKRIETEIKTSRQPNY
jgi:hypothetical protein